MKEFEDHKNHLHEYFISFAIFWGMLKTTEEAQKVAMGGTTSK